MLISEILLRVGTVAILLLSGAIQLRDAPRTESGPLAGLLSLSVAAYVALTVPVPHPVWFAALEVAAAGTPALLWIWAGRVFDDRFEPSWRDVIAWMVAPVLRAIGFYAWHPGLRWALAGLSLLFTVLAVWRVLAGLREDLVERRRRVRPVLAAFAIFYSAKIVVSDLTRHGTPASESARLIDALLLAALALAFALLSLAARRPFAESQPVAETAAPPAPVPPANDQEAALLAKLDRLMQEERVYRRDGFGMASLAEQLDVPEYRLRRLINQRLGHKNFTAFVNGHRLAEAMAALADPQQAAVPILTIALDAGFQSIGPFNRAFKAHTGLTPTAFRRQAESKIG